MNIMNFVFAKLNLNNLVVAAWDYSFLSRHLMKFGSNFLFLVIYIYVFIYMMYV